MSLGLSPCPMAAKTEWDDVPIKCPHCGTTTTAAGYWLNEPAHLYAAGVWCDGCYPGFRQRLKLSTRGWGFMSNQPK